MSEPFKHVNTALEGLSKPGQAHPTGRTMAWVYDWGKMNDATKRDIIEIDQLLTQTELRKEEVEPLAAEITFATAYNDHVSLSFIIRKLQSRISVKRKGREDTKAVVVGTTPKISVPTTLQKMRRVVTGRGGEKDKSEEEWVADGQQ